MGILFSLSLSLLHSLESLTEPRARLAATLKDPPVSSLLSAMATDPSITGFLGGFWGVRLR